MEFDQFKNIDDNHLDDSISFREMFEKYIKYLKWFILSVIISLTLAYFKLKYETPKYGIQASILIKEADKGRSIADLSAFEDLGLFGSGNNDLKNEIQILKSRKLMNQVVDELKLNITYFIEDSPYDKEQYPNFPIIFNIKPDSLNAIKFSSKFEIIVISNNKFEFIGFDGEPKGIKSFGTDFKADLGNDKISDIRIVNIELNDLFKKNLKGKKINVFLKPFDVTVNNFLGKINIEPIDELKSKVIHISINESVKRKGIAIINNLIEQYNADGINDKNLISKTTTDFLNDRLNLISTELKAIETTAAQFKTNRGIVNANAGAANIYLQTSSNTEGELVNANTQLQLILLMIDELNRRGKSDPLPGNIGLSDVSIINLISEYNKLILRRNRILKSSSLINPIITSIDSELGILKYNLSRSLENLKSTIGIQITALNNNRAKIGSRIASVPRYEKEYNEIVRGQETKNTLFLFLLQKREESILSSAISIEKAKIIDSAFAGLNPVSPKKNVLYLVSLIIGLLIPASIIYLKETLDTKVHNEKDLEKLKVPIIGDVPEVKSKKYNYIKEGESTQLAEAFRFIRTNLGFMLDKQLSGKTIFITSTIKGEGKTFTAINLAVSIAMTGKKTVLLGMDLRAPRISKYLGVKEKQGVTNFIKNNELSYNDIIDRNGKIPNLDLINSGDIPPNPVELLMSKRVEELFDYCKTNYDYVIVDTAPVGMVTDTIQISKYADLTIYVVKANFLDKRMLQIPTKLSKENKLVNMSLLLNSVDQKKGGYGYGYGYGATKKKVWYKKLFNFN